MAKQIVDIYHGDTINTYTEFCDNTSVVLHKATQGYSFVDSKAKTRCTEFEKRGLPFWLYVFLNKGGEKKQMDFAFKTFETFLANKKHFIGWVLDIEAQNKVSDCLEALKYTYEYCKKHNCKVMVYFSKSSYDEYNYKKLIDYMEDKKEICGYWEACYSVAPHKFADLWQYTGSGIITGLKNKGDKNKVMARNISWFTTPVSKTNNKTNKAADKKPAKNVDVYNLALAVLQGKYGSGATRKKKLGDDYKTVQDLINVCYDLAERAKTGTFGNGETRKKKLGKYYKIVQYIINNE